MIPWNLEVGRAELPGLGQGASLLLLSPPPPRHSLRCTVSPSELCFHPALGASLVSPLWLILCSRHELSSVSRWDGCTESGRHLQTPTPSSLPVLSATLCEH